MLYFLISCISFILLSNSFNHNPSSPAVESEMTLLLNWFGVKLSTFLVFWFQKSKLIASVFKFPVNMPLRKNILAHKVANEGQEGRVTTLLDLPELALDCILECLSPADLCSVSAVCTSLRDRCTSDHLWEKHLKNKWGRVIGEAAHRQWKCHVASKKRYTLLNQQNSKGLFATLNGFWPFLRNRTKSKNGRLCKSSLPDESIMSWYLSLEKGEFSFPAQVFNRENGHSGFMLSCYDAQLSYDSHSDTFIARYSPHGGWATEENIHWNRLRAPPIDIPSHVLHISDCLDDLKPGDHVEIQWRRNKGFPHGWWYGVIGHSVSCHRNGNRCQCHDNDTVMLEFNQYTPGSRWRQALINRKDHREYGNEVDGYYGGIRKLHCEEEVSRWKNLWPKRVVE